MEFMMPDNICAEMSNRGCRIKVTELDADYIRIEGSAESLLHLSKLFASMVTASDSGFQLAPNGAGHALFSPGLTKGLYIQRID